MDPQDREANWNTAQILFTQQSSTVLPTGRTSASLSFPLGQDDPLSFHPGHDKSLSFSLGKDAPLSFYLGQKVPLFVHGRSGASFLFHLGRCSRLFFQSGQDIPLSFYLGTKHTTVLHAAGCPTLLLPRERMHTESWHY